MRRLHRGRSTGRGRRASFGEHGVDVLVRRRDDTNELTDGARITLADQTLSEHAITARNELHDRLVGFDLGEWLAALDGVTFVLQPFHQAPLFHRWRERFHENLGGHGKGARGYGARG